MICVVTIGIKINLSTDLFIHTGWEFPAIFQIFAIDYEALQSMQRCASPHTESSIKAHKLRIAIYNYNRERVADSF